MSWAITVIGTPDEVSTCLEEYGQILTGDSREEFDAAQPLLRGLVAQNFGLERYGSGSALRLEAYGSGARDSATGAQVYQTCSVSLKVVKAETV